VKIEDRIEQWRYQEGGKEDELYIDLLIEAEDELRRLRFKVDSLTEHIDG
jgi:hypothetical protein